MTEEDMVYFCFGICFIHCSPVDNTLLDMHCCRIKKILVFVGNVFKARIVFERIDAKATLILAHVTRTVMCLTMPIHVYTCIGIQVS